MIALACLPVLHFPASSTNTNCDSAFLSSVQAGEGVGRPGWGPSVSPSLKSARLGRPGMPFTQDDISTSGSIATLYWPTRAHCGHKAGDDLCRRLQHLRGTRAELWAGDKDFLSLHVCSLLNAVGQALGTGSVSPPYCSTESSVICLVALTHQKERVSEGAASGPLQL